MWGVKAILILIPILTIIEAASPGDTRTGGSPEVELQTIVREDFTFTEKVLLLVESTYLLTSAYTSQSP